MENLFALSPIAVACAPVVIGLVQVAKTVGLSARFSPLASVVFGIGLVALTGIAWQAFLVQGIIIGLVASGLWAGSKASFAAAPVVGDAPATPSVG